jgi:hypothetical protein
MSKASIAISTTFSNSTTMAFHGPVATVKQASGKGPALVDKSLGQTGGMRAYNRLQCTVVLSSSFLTPVS